MKTRYLWDGDQIAEVWHHRDGGLVHRHHWVHDGRDLLVKQRQNTDGCGETDFVTSGHNGEPQTIFNQSGNFSSRLPELLYGENAIQPPSLKISVANISFSPALVTGQTIDLLNFHAVT
ncbi:hypothetical protein PSR30_13640 [Pectobacterium carotovorum subsp. carotovorum]|nr:MULTISPECIES: hypothetical protein [Pectobacterium]WDF97468.1 hypothetical protein PSR30_13640 [Pectobacterium carotovorum subsp. carotovorum]